MKTSLISQTRIVETDDEQRHDTAAGRRTVVQNSLASQRQQFAMPAPAAPRVRMPPLFIAAAAAQRVAAAPTQLAVAGAPLHGDAAYAAGYVAAHESRHIRAAAVVTIQPLRAACLSTACL